MPGRPPDGTPVPPDGRLEPAALDQLGTVPFGIYVHVPFCSTRCGYCDFNTYTAAELGGGAIQGQLRRPGHRRGQAGPRGARGGRAAGQHRVLRRRDADAAAAGRPGRHPGRDRRRVRPRAGRRGDHRGQSGERGPAGAGRAAGGRVHQDLARHAELGRARAEGPGPRPLAGAGGAVRGLGAIGRVRPGQPGPDLRHARREPGRLGAIRATARSRRGPITSRRTR